MKIFRYICRLIVGLVFVFSGAVKAIDPMGTVYKLQDYFQAFNLDFLRHLSLLLTIILCTAEFLAGFSVLLNVRQKTGIKAVLVLMIIFTPLTFIMAVTNPVTDCGCFGDAIKLTNWQTFFKNIVLLALAVYLFITINAIRPHSGISHEWTTLIITGTLFIAFIFFNLRYLPVIDFLPYKVGSNIPANMVVPEGKPNDIYETTFIYEKEGVKKEFTLENYPSNDSTWKFVDQKSVLVTKGYQPPVHDFRFSRLDGTDVTSEILESDNFVMLMVSKKLSEADPENLSAGFDLGEFCIRNGVNFLILTASGQEEAEKFSRGLFICQGDETTLKTMVRANPGYLLIRKGTIAGKWSWAGLPDNETIKKIINKQ